MKFRSPKQWTHWAEPSENGGITAAVVGALLGAVFVMARRTW